MAGIYPIPSGRSSDVLLNMQAMFQLQNQQKMLLKVQQQLATGQRLQVPSDDPSSSVRTIGLQRLLEQGSQIQRNLDASQSYVSAADSALSAVADVLAQVRGLAVRAVDTTTSQQERKAIAAEVSQALQRMVDVGNESFRGRFLFAGSDSSRRPFAFQRGNVSFHGNNTALNSYSDLDRLFQTNLPGQELFGAVSTAVRGIDLNAKLNASTRLADLRGGVGIRPGRFTLSDGTHRSTVDIASAETIGDVVRLIEANPPEGRTVRARLTATGLFVSIDTAGGGSLAIIDEPGSTAARELGIARASGLASEPITGSDLDPILRPTTRLDDLLGVRASTVDSSADPGNDIVLEADGGGSPWDRQAGLQIRNGGEVFQIDLRHAETVQDLLNTLNGSGAFLLAEINAERNGIDVRSRLSGADFSIGENGGSTATDLGLRTMTADTELASLDYGRGAVAAEGADLIIRRPDGSQFEVDIATASTVGDVLELINGHSANQDPSTAVTARLRTHGNGIELVSDNPAGPHSLSVLRGPLSYAAWGLGLVPHGADQASPENWSAALPAVAKIQFAQPHHQNTAMRLTASQPGTAMNGVLVEFRNTLSGDAAKVTYDNTGRRLIIDVADGQTTANTVLAAVIEQGTFHAALDQEQDATNDGSGVLVAPPGVAAVADGGTPEALSGFDANPVETQGIFNSLLKLTRAIDDGNTAEIERVARLLDNDFDRLSFGRAELATRAQGLDALQARHQDEQDDLRSILSGEFDVDLAEAASNFAARQTNYQATLQSMSNFYRLTLLDFL